MVYYRTTFAILGGVLLAALLAWLLASGWREQARVAHRATVQRGELARSERARLEAREALLEAQLTPLRAFTAEWQPHLRPAAAKDLGNQLRNGLATLATRTGLTAEGATVPVDGRAYAVGSRSIRVQPVSLSVIGDSLPAILTWLGAAENAFPYARVEALHLAPYGSRSVQLTVTLLHPLEDTPAATPSLPNAP
jgi:hypothetical protein